MPQLKAQLRKFCCSESLLRYILLWIWKETGLTFSGCKVNLLKLAKKSNIPSNRCAINSHFHSYCSVKPVLNFASEWKKLWNMQEKPGGKGGGGGQFCTVLAAEWLPDSNYADTEWLRATNAKMSMRQWMWWADTNSSIWITQLSIHQKRMTRQYPDQAKKQKYRQGWNERYLFFCSFFSLEEK